LQTTGFQPFSLSVGGEVRRKLLNPPAFSWWSFSFLQFDSSSVLPKVREITKPEF